MEDVHGALRGHELESEICAALHLWERVDLPLREVAAVPRVVRARLRGIDPGKYGIQYRAWGRVKKLVGRALRDLGLEKMPSRFEVELLPEWVRLLGRLSKQEANLLKRFARWCSMRGLTPRMVSATHFEEFCEDLKETCTEKNARCIYLGTCNAWNAAGEHYRFWPRVRAAPVLARLWYTRDWSAYLPRLIRDIDATLEARRTGTRWFKRRGTIGPTTQATERHSLRRYLHALVEVGVPIERLRRLEDCFTIERARAALGWIKDQRHGGDDRLDLYNTALMVRTFATVRCKQPLAPFDRLVDDYGNDKIFKRSPLRLQGLVLLANPKVRDGLFAVARGVLEDYEHKEILQFRQAVRVEAAFALQIAWATGRAPSRLVDFQWGKDVRVADDGSLEVHSEGDRWNRAPRVVDRLARLYTQKARPRLYRVESHLVFPGHKQGANRNPTALSRAITRVVAEKSGHRFIALHALQALIAADDLDDADTREALMAHLGYRTPSTIEHVRTVLAKKRVQDEHSKQVAGGRHARTVSVAASSGLARGDRKGMA